MKKIRRFILPIFLGSLPFFSHSLATPISSVSEDQLWEQTQQAIKNKDWTVAIPGIQQLVKQEHREAQFKLGNLYRNGYGVEKDLSQSFFWYKKAAGLGHNKAQAYLAMSYEMGRGTQRDIKQATIWYQKAAEQKNLQAMHWLADSYLNGSPLPQDYEKAYIWYSLAHLLDPECNRIQSGKQEAWEHLTHFQRKKAKIKIEELLLNKNVVNH